MALFSSSISNQARALEAANSPPENISLTSSFIHSKNGRNNGKKKKNILLIRQLIAYKVSSEGSKATKKLINCGEGWDPEAPVS